MSTSPLTPVAVLGWFVASLLLSCYLPVSALQGAPDQLLAWKVSGCTASPGRPNDTTHCPFSTPTTLTIEGSGFLPYAPSNFSLCLNGPHKVTAPFNGSILDDGTLTVTTSEQFYLSTGATQWGSQWLYVYLAAALDFSCEQPSFDLRIRLTADFPEPQVTSVSGCSDVGPSTFNCSRDSPLTVHGSGFTTFAYQISGGRPLYNGSFSIPTGKTVDDSTVVIPAGCYGGKSPAPYTDFSFGLLFNPGPIPVYGNGSVTISMLPYHNDTTSGSSSSGGALTSVPTGSSSTTGGTGGLRSSSGLGSSGAASTSTPPPLPSSSSSSGLSTSAVIGIIVPVVLLSLGVVVGALYYRQQRYKAARRTTAATEPMMASSWYHGSGDRETYY